MRALLAGGALLGLAACTPQQCDPSQAGFFSGIGCAASGSYATRSQYQQVELAQQRAAAAQNRDQAQEQGARASQALLTRDQTRRRLAAVDGQNTQLRARLASARARGSVDQARLAPWDASVPCWGSAARRMRTSAGLRISNGGSGTNSAFNAPPAQRRGSAP